MCWTARSSFSLLAGLLLAACSSSPTTAGGGAGEGANAGIPGPEGGWEDGASAGGSPASNANGGDAVCTGWPTLQRLSPQQVHELLATTNPIVINVHVPYEGDIPGTDADIAYTNVDVIEALVEHNHCAEIVLVCKAGGMSQSAGNELVKRGYLRVRDLLGGMQAWEAAGYPLQS
jgi:rhodanese-related sulfurtransferase